MSSWNLMETTAPQISSPTMNCSPSMANTRFSQHRELKPEIHKTHEFENKTSKDLKFSTFPQPDDPFSTEFVRLIFPHGFDSCQQFVKGAEENRNMENNQINKPSERGEEQVKNKPILKRWKSLWLASSPGLTMWL